MAGISINRVTNANIYLNGASMLGKAAEVNLPMLKPIMSDHGALGLAFKIELASGMDKMEASFKWTSFYKDVIAATANPFAVQEMQIRCSISTYSGSALTAETPAVIYLTGQFKDNGLGNFKQHENVDTDSKFNVFAMRFEIGGKAVVEVDAFANIYKVNGEDILQGYRQNIGG